MLKKGFTLLELLLVIAFIAIIATIAIPFYHSYQVRSDLDVSLDVTVQSLRRSKALAQSGDGDSAWGTYFQASEITIFKGASYASRDTTRDEVFSITSSITPSGTTEIVFSKFYGIPDAAGMVILTASTGDVRNVMVNEKGMIDY